MGIERNFVFSVDFETILHKNFTFEQGQLCNYGSFFGNLSVYQIFANHGQLIETNKIRRHSFSFEKPPNAICSVKFCLWKIDD